MAELTARTRLNAFWLGQTSGALGAGVIPVVVGLIAATTLDAGPAEMAAVTVASLLPRVLFTLHAGAYVERLGRWRAMLWSNIAESLVWCCAIGYSVLFGNTLAVLILAVFLSDSARAVNGVAFQSVAPLLADKDGLRSVNAKFGLSDAFAQVVAPVLGSWLFLACGGPATIGVGIALIGVLIVAILGCRTVEVVPVQVRSTGIHQLVIEGLRFVRSDRLLRGLALSNMSANFFLAFISALWLLYLLDGLGWSPRVVGIVGGIGAVGGLLGAPLALFASRLLGDSRTLVLLSWLFCPVYLVALIPLTGFPRILLVTASTALVALCLVAYNVLQRTLRQSMTPPELLSRLSASVRWTSAIGAPLGAALGGFLGTVTTVGFAVTAGILGLLVPGVLTSSAGLWRSPAAVGEERETGPEFSNSRPK